MVIIALVAAALATGGVLAVVLTPPPSPCSGVAGALRSFTIIADSNGYNGSLTKTGSWPVVTVQRCDNVVFTVINNSTESHGFAVGFKLRGPDSSKSTARSIAQFTDKCRMVF